MNIGEVRHFPKVTDQNIAHRYFSARMREENANTEWVMDYWSDGNGGLYAMRADGMSPNEIQVRRLETENTDPRGGRGLTWCPYTWNLAQGANARQPYALTIKSTTSSVHRWENMDIGARKIVHMTWTNLRTSLLTQMVRRELRWVFQINERPELNVGKPRAGKPTYWEVVRIA